MFLDTQLCQLQSFHPKAEQNSKGGKERWVFAAVAGPCNALAPVPGPIKVLLIQADLENCQ